MGRILMFLISLLLIGNSAAVAQNQEDESIVDELYEKARKAAFNGENYSKAREYAYEALNKSPYYHELRVFIARLYSWEGDYKSARVELHRVLNKDPKNHNAYMAIVDVERWSENYDEALRLVNKAIEFHPHNEELLLKKASVMYSVENYEKSEEVYTQVLEQDKNNAKAEEGLESAKLKQMKYSTSISYRHDHFREIFDSWQFAEIGLSRQTSYGSITGRVQYAQRFGSSGTQFNLDAYPSLFEGMYAYISGGYSDSFVYPEYRFGISFYKSLPASFELEAGIRYLDFNSSQTDIYIASLTKYLGSYLFTVRNYFIPSPQDNSNSISGIVRRYFGDERTYLSFTGGFGSATTEIEFSQDIQTLESWSIGVDGQYPLSNQFLIGGSAGYESSKYQNFVRERFSVKASVTYRF